MAIDNNFLVVGRIADPQGADRLWVLIKDRCLTGRKSVTNDAEAVMLSMLDDYTAEEEDRVFYIDSEGDLGELIRQDDECRVVDPVPIAKDAYEARHLKQLMVCCF